MNTPKGKHVTIDWDNPEGIGICDYSGEVFNHRDLIKQMEWRGNELVWTGYLVGRPYLDKPNEQLRTPILPPDPVPYKLVRPYHTTNIVWENIYDNWENLTVDTWADWQGEFDGVPALPENQRLLQLQKATWSSN